MRKERVIVLYFMLLGNYWKIKGFERGKHIFAAAFLLIKKKMKVNNNNTLQYICVSPKLLNYKGEVRKKKKKGNSSSTQSVRHLLFINFFRNNLSFIYVIPYKYIFPKKRSDN